MENRKKERDAADAAWMLMATIVVRATMFLVNIFTARLVSINDFGAFSLVRSTIIFMESLVSNTFGLAVTRKSALGLADPKKIKTLFISSASVVMSFAALVAVAILVTTSFVNLQERSIPISDGIIEVGIFVLLSVSMATLTQNQVIGMGRYKDVAFGALVATTISSITIFLTRNNYSIYWALIVIAIYYVTAVSYYWIVVFRGYMSETVKWFDVKREVLSGLLEARWLMLGVAVNGGAFWLGRILLLNSENGLFDAAMFDAAFQILSFIMLFSNSVYSAIFPKMVRREMESGSPSVGCSIDVLKVTLLLVLALIVLVWLFSEQFLGLYGPEYAPAEPVLKILAFSGLSFTAALHFNRLMVAREQRHHLAAAAVLGAGSMHLCYYLLGYDANGLSVGVNVYYCSGLIYYMWNVGILRGKRS